MGLQSTTGRQLATRWAIGLAAVGWLTTLGSGVWYEAAQRRQAQFAEQLAARILKAESTAPRAVVAELAQLDLAGIEPLVRLAALQRSDVAEAAQGAISQLLQAWELAATESGDVRQFAERAAVLADALELHAAEFGPEGQRWANQLAERLVTHSEQFATAESWEILANCDRVLSRPLQPRPPRAPMIVVAPLDPAGGTHSTAPAKTAAQGPPPAQQNAEARATARVERPAAELSVVGSTLSASTQLSLQQQLGSTLRTALRFADEHAEAERRRREQLTRVTPVGAVVDVPSPQDVREQTRQARRSGAQPAVELPVDPHVVKLDAKPQAALQAIGPQGRPRNDAVAELTKQLAALPAAERLAGLERATQLPSVEARLLLRNFVADEDPKIRLRALTMLATAGDPKLIELARERAVEDADPRVSAFASELLRMK